MPRARDTQRAKVYRAEKAIWTEAKPWTMEETRAYVHLVEKTALWAEMRRFKSPVDVSDGRGRRSAVAYASLNSISLPRWGRQPAVILHELAHVTVSSTAAGHGPEFARAYLKLVSRFMGSDAAAKLRAAYAAQGVRVARGTK